MVGSCHYTTNCVVVTLMLSMHVAANCTTVQTSQKEKKITIKATKRERLPFSRDK